MDNKFNGKVLQTYLDPQWVEDPVDRSLEFNFAKHYRIAIGDNPTDPEGFYHCPHCKENNLNTILFLIERKDPNKLKCVTCHSIIETK